MSVRRGEEMTYRVLCLYVFLCAWTVALLQALSPFFLVRFAPVLIGVVLGVGIACKRWIPHPKAWREGVRDWSASRSFGELLRPECLPFICAAAPIVVLLFIQGIHYPPNDFDAMTYHLARAAYWRQWHSLGHYTTNSVLQVGYPGNVEVLFCAQLVLLSTARLAFLVPLGAYVATAAAVYGIGRQAGAGRPAALFGAGLFATFPEVVQQSNSAMIDISAASFVVCGVYFFVDAIQTGRTGSLLCAGMALGLAIGAKPITMFALPGLLLVGVFLVFPCRDAGSFPRKWLGDPRKHIHFPGRRNTLVGFGLLLTMAVLAAPWYLENLLDFGSFLGPPRVSNLQLIQSKSAVTFLVNLFRHLIAFIDPSGPAMIFQGTNNWFNHYFSDLRVWLAEVTGAGADVPIEFEYTTYTSAPFSSFVDGVTWFGLCGALAVGVTLGYSARLLFRHRFGVTALCAAGAVSSLFFTTLFLVWQPWESRFLITMAALCCPVAALAAQRLSGHRVGSWALCLVAIYASIGAPTAAVQNLNRPLSSWNADYNTLLAGFYPWMAPVLNAVDTLVPDHATVGIMVSANRIGWEFPFFGKDLTRTLIPIKLPASSGGTFPGSPAFSYEGSFTYLITDESDSIVAALFAAKPALHCVSLARLADGYSGFYQFFKCANITLEDLYQGALRAQQAGDFAADLTLLDQVSHINPNYKDTQFAKGWALWNTGHPTAAIATYRAYLTRHPNNAQAQLNLGYSLAKLGRCDEAVGPLRKVLAMQPKSAPARQDLAVCGVK